MRLTGWGWLLDANNRPYARSEAQGLSTDVQKAVRAKLDEEVGRIIPKRMRRPSEEVPYLVVRDSGEQDKGTVVFVVHDQLVQQLVVVGIDRMNIADLTDDPPPRVVVNTFKIMDSRLRHAAARRTPARAELNAPRIIAGVGVAPDDAFKFGAVADSPEMPGDQGRVLPTEPQGQVL